MAIPITTRGLRLLKEELEHLKTKERPAVINAIAEARAQGDLSENAEYDAAREKQAFIEGRIKDIESRLSQAQVIDPLSLVGTTKVVFSATVELEEVASGQTLHYQIVGEDEADIKQNKISISSPLARALIGREEGDEVTITAPGGTVVYQIVEISYRP